MQTGESTLKQAKQALVDFDKQRRSILGEKACGTVPQLKDWQPFLDQYALGRSKILGGAKERQVVMPHLRAPRLVTTS